MLIADGDSTARRHDTIIIGGLVGARTPASSLPLALRRSWSSFWAHRPSAQRRVPTRTMSAKPEAIAAIR